MQFMSKFSLGFSVCSMLAIVSIQAVDIDLSEAEVEAIAIETYIYGYPLITMDLTKRVSTNVEQAEGSRAPLGQFANLQSYPNASFKTVTAPNADTLYSSAWLDVGKEPYILHVPDEKDRYYLLPMLSGWTDVFADPGTRTTGTGAADFAITGPNWKGSLPSGIKEYKSPTNIVWILGRTYCSGTPEDYKLVHAIQDQYKLVPLSSYGKEYFPPKGTIDPNIDIKTPVREQVQNLKIEDFFNKMTGLMTVNPPLPADAPMLEKMTKIGVVPGKRFEISQNEKWAAMLSKVPELAQKKILAQEKEAGKSINGWLFSQQTGSYGTDYLQRAFVTAVGLGANLPEDAIYPITNVDSQGKQLNGANKYVVHFEKGQTPPVKGFWSLTMYNDKFYFVDNALNRYNLSERNTFNTNADGSIDLYIQNASPGANKEANWLPAPTGNFILMLRTYWPEPAILNGTWSPPSIQKVE